LRASSTASIQFKNVKVPPENLIGKPGDGFRIAMTILNYGRLALGAASSGMLEISYEDMVKRAASRIQFGGPLDRFELIQEKILKAYVHKEVVSAITNLTAGLLAGDPLANIAPESSHCKLYGTNRAWETLYDALQVAGGAGYLRSLPYEKRLRDFRVTTIFEGTTEIHSIYPPLFLAREIMTAMKFRTRTAPGRLFFFVKAWLKPAFWRIPVKDPALKRAVTVVKKNARRFRVLFLLALLTSGKALPRKEFLLRRLTAISTHIYALLALVVKIRYRQELGRDTGDLLAALEYFTVEAARECDANYRLKPDKIEKMHARLFSRLFNKPGVQ
jgi:acyl-CoA dehydrogenase family protein 9